MKATPVEARMKIESLYYESTYYRYGYSRKQTLEGKTPELKIKYIKQLERQ